ncbi:MAG: tetratricopeptide repeat protein [Candidatus Thorarchaeota archaeon]|jgi:tetratricopeptide (TPR) repeat protein
MTPTPEELLQESSRLHSVAEFKKGMKTAEKARKKFQKAGRVDRAIEALRIMGDCVVNMHELKKAEKLYNELLEEGLGISNKWYQAASHWGLGQVSFRRMDYPNAVKHFEKGLELARSIADKWYVAWNAFGLALALRGLARLTEARPLLQEAITVFNELDQTSTQSWAEKALQEISGETEVEQDALDEIRIWLCPMCGSKFNGEQVSDLKSRKIITCEYCGTISG